MAKWYGKTLPPGNAASAANAVQRWMEMAPAGSRALLIVHGSRFAFEPEARALLKDLLKKFPQVSLLLLLDDDEYQDSAWSSIPERFGQMPDLTLEEAADVFLRHVKRPLYSTDFGHAQPAIELRRKEEVVERLLKHDVLRRCGGKIGQVIATAEQVDKSLPSLDCL